jgi:hypothetical protein
MTDREIELLLESIKERAEGNKEELARLREWTGKHEDRLRGVEAHVSEQRGRDSSRSSTVSNVFQVLGILVAISLGLLGLIFG